MSDVERGLPVRSKDDSTDNRVLVKIQDGAAPAGANNTMTVSEDLAHVRMFATDAGGTKRQLRLSESGNVALDGDYNVTTNSNPSSAGLILHDRVASPAVADQNFRPTGVTGSVLNTVHAMDVALHDESGNPYALNNPMPVAISESEGDEIVDYQTSAAVATTASVQHDYTVTTAKTFVGKQLLVSASSRWKAELQIETAAASGTYNTVATFFGTEAKPNVAYDLKGIHNQIPLAKVRVEITNRDNQAQDVYSTLLAVEV